MPWFICSARAALKTNELKHNFNVASLSASIYEGRVLMMVMMMMATFQIDFNIIFSKLQNVFIKIANFFLSDWQNVLIKIAKCIYMNQKKYLSQM